MTLLNHQSSCLLKIMHMLKPEISRRNYFVKKVAIGSIMGTGWHTWPFMSAELVSLLSVCTGWWAGTPRHAPQHWKQTGNHLSHLQILPAFPSLLFWNESSLLYKMIYPCMIRVNIIELFSGASTSLKKPFSRKWSSLKLVKTAMWFFCIMSIRYFEQFWKRVATDFHSRKKVSEISSFVFRTSEGRVNHENCHFWVNSPFINERRYSFPYWV